MATREVLSIGHPALREVAQPVPAADVTSAETQGLIDDLIATMRHAYGAGLAATQVGEPVRIAVMEVGDNPRYPYKPRIPLIVAINPVIEPLDDEVVRGLTAATWQHECDHLDGVLFIDKVDDPTTLSTWDEYETHHRDAFVERITAFVGRVGS